MATTKSHVAPRHALFERLDGRILCCTDPHECVEAPSRAVLAIDAGGVGGVGDDGQVFELDRGFTGGRIILAEASDTQAEQTVMGTAREGKEFSFSARVPNGKYTLELHFAHDGETTRRFDIVAEDGFIATDWRVPESADSDDPLVRRFNVEVLDGRLSLGFSAGAGRAIVNAIVLTPGLSIFPDPISWRASADIPVAREESQSFVWNDRLYIVGGYIDGDFRATHRVDRLDPATGKWSRISDAPTKITHAGVAIDQREETVWFVGGYIGDFPAPDATAAVWKYDLNSDTWSRGPSLPAARGAGGAAIVGRKLYFFSGANKERTADQGQHWALDLDNPQKWRGRAPLPNPRNHFATVVVKDQIYAVGGQHLLELASVNQADVHRYDVTTDTWTALALMPRPYSHFTFATAVYNNRYIVTAGGESPHDVGRSDVYVFDTRRNRWGEMTELPQVRRAAAGGIIDGRLYVVAGYDRAIGQASDLWSANLLPAFT